MKVQPDYSVQPKEYPGNVKLKEQTSESVQQVDAKLEAKQSKIKSEDDPSVNNVDSMQSAIEKVETHTNIRDVGLMLKIDKDLDNRIVVQLLDKVSKEIIRQIPSEEVLELAKHLANVFEEKDDKASGMMGNFLDDKA